jgi:cyclic beta-1,2-glucan synthetase
VRENGGQYSHAGVWAVMAQASAHTRGMPVPAGTAARCDLAYQYFTDLSPAHRSAHPVHGPLYGLEPYALAGDVYGHAPYGGRGGWSWYTGAAGMLHRAAIESMFGLTQTASTLCFAPCLPSHWNQATLILKRDGKRLHFQLIRVPNGAAHTTSARWDATVLGCGELLHWPALPDGSRFVITLD